MVAVNSSETGKYLPEHTMSRRKTVIFLFNTVSISNLS
jgi:hypothetical protein